MQTTPPQLLSEYRRRGWWSETRIPDLFDASARANPARLAVADAPNRTTLTGAPALRLNYLQLEQLATAYMLRFIDLGLVRDDILITQLPNIAEYVAVYLAALKLGMIVSPVPMQYRQHELELILSLTRAKALLTLTQFKENHPAQDAQAVTRRHGTQLLVLGNQAGSGMQALDGAEPTPAQRQILQQHLQHHKPSSDDIATICWTSGTEGKPKGVPRSHNHWMAISLAHLDGAGIRPADVLLNPFPLVNMAALGGCFMSWLHTGGTLLLHHPLDLPVYLEQIATDRPQYAIAPPAVLNRLLRDERLLALTDLSSLRCIGSGSAPLDPAMIRGFHDRFGIEIANMFGSNEGVSLVSSAAEAPEPEQRASLFPRFGRSDVHWPQRIASAIETRLVDPEQGSEILKAGQPGELQIRGPTVFDGYYAAPELTAEVFTPDGYFRTGDLFEIAASGGELRYYRFLGRLKQLIVRGGVKIAPEEIEALLTQHPDIAEASAMPYPDPVLGERICAVVVPRQHGAEIPLVSIQSHFRNAGVAVFKWPERVRTVASLPRNAVGKVVRQSLVGIAEASA